MPAICIIGGSGFVGTRLTVRLLAAGHTVTIADKNDSHKYPHVRVYADVREPDTLEAALTGFDGNKLSRRTPRRRYAKIIVRRR